MHRRRPSRRLLRLATLVLGLGIVTTGTRAADGLIDRESGLAAFRGEAICLRSASTSAIAVPCTEDAVDFGLRTQSGRILRFLADDLRAGAFEDPRVRAQPIEVRGWLRDNDGFEILRVFTLKDGILHHVHYRCDICDIDASGPGPCWCCGQDFELREDPQN